MSQYIADDSPIILSQNSGLAGVCGSPTRIDLQSAVFFLILSLCGVNTGLTLSLFGPGLPGSCVLPRRPLPPSRVPRLPPVFFNTLRTVPYLLSRWGRAGGASYQYHAYLSLSLERFGHHVSPARGLTGACDASLEGGCRATCCCCSPRDQTFRLLAAWSLTDTPRDRTFEADREGPSPCGPWTLPSCAADASGAG